MAAAAELQSLLRFLTNDAKIPLSACLAKVADLRKAQLTSAENIAKASQQDLLAIFNDQKIAKQAVNAAKRVTNPKKRPAADTTSPVPKRAKGTDGEYAGTSESDLGLPASTLDEAELSKAVLQTNRAPLVLAFAVMLLKHTMPEQPISSQLSLAQAVVSANSQSKAKSIGLTSGSTAEEEGWGKGQPKIKVMGREIAVMRRATAQVTTQREEEANAAVGQSTVQAESQADNHERFWGLDLDALRKSNGPLVAGKNATGRPGLPIHTAEAARNYLIRSMVFADPEESSEGAPSKKKQTPREIAAKKEEACAALLTSLDLLYESWASTLSKIELDRRAWSWYLHVRPDIAQGQAGWGQKGHVKLADILALRRKSDI